MQVEKIHLNDNRITDFEDGLEYYSAKQTGCDFKVTEDDDDFWFSSICVMNCRDFLLYLHQMRLM